jgi:hypothetical protein
MLLVLRAAREVVESEATSHCQILNQGLGAWLKLVESLLARPRLLLNKSNLGKVKTMKQSRKKDN